MKGQLDSERDVSEIVQALESFAENVAVNFLSAAEGKITSAQAAKLSQNKIEQVCYKIFGIMREREKSIKSLTPTENE